MEEWVGKHWHHFIVQRGSPRYPQAEMTLESCSKSLGVLFRALGGDGGLKIAASIEQQHRARRSWLQRLAGNNTHIPLAWRDQQSLNLPAKLDIFPQSQLNQNLYLWLVAMAAADVTTGVSWVDDNQQRVLWVLNRFPGFKKMYQQLVSAQLLLRPQPCQLHGVIQAQEQAIRLALQAPGLLAHLPESKQPPQPVYLWLHPEPPLSGVSHNQNHNSDVEEQTSEPSKSREAKQSHRYRAEQTEMPEGEDGLLTIRWENIFSWGEYIKVDRCSDDEEDPNASEIARDMEQLHVARDQQGASSRLRLDLDLPSAAYDDTPLTGRHLLPEWDWRQQRLVANHCQLQLMLPRGSQPKPLPARLQQQAQRLRQQFSALAQQRSWQNAQSDGSELDLQAYLDFYSARRSGLSQPERGLYRQLQSKQRSLATLLLADLSLSTDAAINDDQRIIDLIQDALLLFAEALSSCGDRFALQGFSSRQREAVRLYPLKGFEQPYNDQVRGHIQAIRPGYYTRMGAAIRYASEQLVKQPASQRLLLLLTDGKPNDLDHYEGRYGVEDTREAIREAKRMGLVPFCITIDREGDDYLPYLFGTQGYTVIQRPAQLAVKLLALYRQLSSI